MAVLDGTRFALLGALPRGQPPTRSHDPKTRASERAHQLLVLLGSSLLGRAARFEVGLADHDKVALLDGIRSRQPGAVWRVNGRNDDLIAVSGDDTVARELVRMWGAVAHGPVRKTRANCLGRRITGSCGLHCGSLLARYRDSGIRPEFVVMVVTWVCCMCGSFLVRPDRHRLGHHGPALPRQRVARTRQSTESSPSLPV